MTRLLRFSALLSAVLAPSVYAAGSPNTWVSPCTLDVVLVTFQDATTPLIGWTYDYENHDRPYGTNPGEHGLNRAVDDRTGQYGAFGGALAGAGVVCGSAWPSAGPQRHDRGRDRTAVVAAGVDGPSRRRAGGAVLVASIADGRFGDCAL